MERMDLTLVCGSRPHLLEQTLSTFANHIFRFIRIETVYANIDLFGGNEKERNKCIQLLTNYFGDVRINSTSENSFGAAVKFLWSQPNTQRFLHLEDDWIALRSFPIEAIKIRKHSKIRQWLLVKPRPEQSLITRYRYRPLPRLPFFFPDITHPSFSTSPSVISTDFAREIAFLLRADLNPEKQMFNGKNKALENFLQNFRCKAIVNWWEKKLIMDIGRVWQETQGLRVEIVDGIHGYKNLDLEK